MKGMEDWASEGKGREWKGKIVARKYAQSRNS